MLGLGMNAVEIEEAVSALAEAPFNAQMFPYDFLQAFGLNDAGIRKLKNGDTNKSDLPRGVLQRNKNNIHLLACPPGGVAAAMEALRASPATAKHKARFILATDGQTIQAERFDDGEPLACDFKELPDRFTFFLSLAGISTVKRIDENAFDIRATGRLNKLYVELLKENPAWDTEARRQDLNHFFARLIFCFFAEDTNIFTGGQLFTETVDQMTERNGSNVHEILAEIFRAMDTRREDRATSDLRPWAMRFPYVNGNLFSGNTETPRFNQSARNYLLFVGNLDWKKINPDIFGSMIQAVADDEERGALGMHYTSVPNILKVLNPLFLDDLRAKLEEAGAGKTPGSARKLLNLRNRLARIRVFDPACGSGNFLVIAYKEMRKIEAEINRLRAESDLKSVIPISNFRGIELRSFPAEIARLALIIAEFQCDVLYRGEVFARLEFLPLDTANWVTCGNAMEIDWLSLWPPETTGVIVQSDDLFGTPKDQAEIDFENAGGETYICGNPPYLGGKGQSPAQKLELANAFGAKSNIGELDYVTGWLRKGAEYAKQASAWIAFVATNSVNQGAQVHQLWPGIFNLGVEIFFAHRDFKWSNNASRNAAVICSIIGLRPVQTGPKYLFSEGLVREVACIGPYLIPGNMTIVTQALASISGLAPMLTGNSPYDGGNLLLSDADRLALIENTPQAVRFVKKIYGAKDYINGEQRYCLWIDDKHLQIAKGIKEIHNRIDSVLKFRLDGGDVAKGLTKHPHKFRYTHEAKKQLIIAPRVSSERRPYIPFGLLSNDCIVSDSAQAVYDANLWNLAILLSLMHMSWVRVVAGRLKTDLRYSSALCYNTFPVPTLTDQNKADLTRCAEDILLAREAHFPATIADLYDPEAMDTKYPDLRAAHDRNDETLERIYIGRRFRNDTERLEKLFELYTQMTARDASPPSSGRAKPPRKK